MFCLHLNIAVMYLDNWKCHAYQKNVLATRDNEVMNMQNVNVGCRFNQRRWPYGVIDWRNANDRNRPYAIDINGIVLTKYASAYKLDETKNDITAADVIDMFCERQKERFPLPFLCSHVLRLFCTTQDYRWDKNSIKLIT